MALFTQLMDCSCSKESYLDDRLEDMDSMHHQLSELVQSVSMVGSTLLGNNIIYYYLSELVQSVSMVSITLAGNSIIIIYYYQLI